MFVEEHGQLDSKGRDIFPWARRCKTCLYRGCLCLNPGFPGLAVGVCQEHSCKFKRPFKHRTVWNSLPARAGRVLYLICLERTARPGYSKGVLRKKYCTNRFTA